MEVDESAARSEEYDVTHYDEDSLIAEAAAVIGDRETVQGAGVFALADMTMASIAGGTVGGSAAFDAANLVTDNVLVDTASNIAGMVAGRHALMNGVAAEEHVSVQLIVAVTDEHIYVLNRKPSADVPPIARTFDRATAHVTIKKIGASRRVTIEDPASEVESIEVTGGTAFFAPTAKGDKIVLALLSN